MISPLDETKASLREMVFSLEDRGAEVGVSDKDCVDEKRLWPIKCIVRSNLAPFEALIEYYGVRYHLLLERNAEIEDSMENARLQDIHHAHKKDYSTLLKAVAAALTPFWPVVAENIEGQAGKTVSEYSPEDCFSQKCSVKLQLKTLAGGSLQALSHNKATIRFPMDDPIPNPCPESLLLKREEIKILSAITLRVVKARVRGEMCCVKYSEPRVRLREISLLLKMPKHPSLPWLVGAVDAGDNAISAFVIPFFSGRNLEFIKAATSEEKEKWKAQIFEAVQFLHRHGIVWGDAKPDNILVEEMSGRVILVDFGGGFNPEYIDRELRETKEGDLQGVRRVQSFIDGMKTAP
eukprot:Plantae.Rhodophyta-Hildenbrandia_rubra.ctg2.p1 GENE.Plantae.Rhodophyta-Hildenbrandia_rubra.ctg2~~Plantae.Rhodophyta-Hildenbrandia_rubra.ctg2.p1  ORF type:complete len:350 (-),score=46.60 Plantae.Rhodophyta-Hildenbrandia_rubra.ctg2:1482-2531(-)